MTSMQKTSQIGTEAVKKLRNTKLRNGIPFMINVDHLKENQCYMEYPNGVIKLVYVNPKSNNIEEIRELSVHEAMIIREQFHFPLI